MKKAVLAAIVLIILIVGGAWALNHRSYKAGQTSTYGSGSNNQANNSNQAPTSTVSVDIHNMMFTPSQITVKKGTKVTWTNNDQVAHTVTPDKGTSPASAPIPPGETYSYTFNQVGSFQYHCSIHSVMHGTVVVYS
jgi:plastocyanin